MIYPVPFEAEHVFKLEIQDAQKWVFDHITMEHVIPLENEWAATLMKDGKPMACVGPIILWYDRVRIWSFIGKGLTNPEFLRMHKMAKRYLDNLPFKRLEAEVSLDFKEGHRWAKMFGFVVEAPIMRACQMNGKDGTLYAKVRD